MYFDNAGLQHPHTSYLHVSHTKTAADGNVMELHSSIDLLSDRRPMAPSFGSHSSAISKEIAR